MTSIIKVDNIQNSSGTSALSIDSSGVVTKSVVPAFRVGLTADQSNTATGAIQLVFNKSNSERCFLNGGVTMAGGIVTVPVGGIYQVNANIRVDAVGGGYIIVQVRINNESSGSADIYSISGTPASNYETLTATEVFKLEAGDNIRVITQTSTDTSYAVDATTKFSGTLVG